MSTKEPEEVAGRKTISVDAVMARLISAFMKRHDVNQQTAIERLIKCGGELIKLIDEDADIWVSDGHGGLERLRILIIA